MNAIYNKTQQRIDAATRLRSTTLDLGGLGIKELPATVAELTWLRQLRLANNRLIALPAEVSTLTELELLDVGNNRLREVPGAISRLQNLAHLDLSENRLSRIPAELVPCSALRTLTLRGNQIEAPLSGVAPFENVVKLDLSANRMATLIGIGHAFPGLRDLDIGENQLTALPEELATLTSLVYLYAAGNCITEATVLSRLPRLREIDLENNRLHSLPLELSRHAALRLLSVDGNPELRLPEELADITGQHLVSDAAAMLETHVVSEKKLPGDVQYMNAPSLLMDFAILLSGVSTVYRFADDYFRRHFMSNGIAATITLPDGVVIELRQLNRKSALELIRQHASALSDGKASVRIDPIHAADRQAAMRGLSTSLARLPGAELSVPAATGGRRVEVIHNHYYGNVAYAKEFIMGDQIGIKGNRGGNIIVKSSNVTLTQGGPVPEDGKQQLAALIEELNAVLKNVSADQRLDAEAIADAAQDLIDKAAKDKPNRKSIEISGKGLIEAAEGIAGVVPIALKIIDTVRTFLGAGA